MINEEKIQELLEDEDTRMLITRIIESFDKTIGSILTSIIKRKQSGTFEAPETLTDEEIKGVIVAQKRVDKYFKNYRILLDNPDLLSSILDKSKII